jgi:hypothetical protein
VRQGDEQMEQIFILDGMLKARRLEPEGREMILRFAAENEMDTSYAAWRLRTPVPYSIVAGHESADRGAADAAVGGFLDGTRISKGRFEYEVMKLMSG